MPADTSEAPEQGRPMVQSLLNTGLEQVEDYELPANDNDDDFA
jgi:hypothetical protein